MSTGICFCSIEALLQTSNDDPEDGCGDDHSSGHEDYYVNGSCDGPDHERRAKPTWTCGYAYVGPQPPKRFKASTEQPTSSWESRSCGSIHGAIAAVQRSAIHAVQSLNPLSAYPWCSLRHITSSVVPDIVSHADKIIRSELHFQPRLFYIGITEHVPIRWFGDGRGMRGHCELYDLLILLAIAPNSTITGDAEDVLIKKWRKHRFCRNVGDGRLHASMGRPHYLYLVLRFDGLIR
jgi:hypothetical protein